MIFVFRELAEHGNASLQDYLTATELDSFVSCGQEGDGDRSHQQDQKLGCKNSLAPLCAP